MFTRLKLAVVDYRLAFSRRVYSKRRCYAVRLYEWLRRTTILCYQEEAEIGLLSRYRGLV